MKPICVACDDTGRNSKGGTCYPCKVSMKSVIKVVRKFLLDREIRALLLKTNRALFLELEDALASNWRGYGEALAEMYGSKQRAMAERAAIIAEKDGKFKEAIKYWHECGQHELAGLLERLEAKL